MNRPPASGPAAQLHAGTSVAEIMRWVLLAALPGVVAQTWFFGWQTLLNVGLCALACIATEALALRWRGRDPRAGIADGSALITAVLLAVALPPGAAWWLPLLGGVLAIGVGKHAFGGLGQNPFNPAMAAYAFLLVCFPLALARWPAPAGITAVDGVTMATALHVVRENHGLLMRDLWQQAPQLGALGGRGWEWVNIGFLGGGLFLVYRRIVGWQAPVGMLAALALCAAAGYDNGSSVSGGSPLFHLFSGATMVGAFFIVTEPVSGPTSPRGRLLGGALVGALTYLLRHASSYPDGVAFATLAMNGTAPLLDWLTRPRVFGSAPTGGRP